MSDQQSAKEAHRLLMEGINYLLGGMDSNELSMLDQKLQVVREEVRHMKGEAWESRRSARDGHLRLAGIYLDEAADAATRAQSSNEREQE